MMGWADWAGVVFVVAVVYVLVRPNSRAAELVEGFTGMLTAMIRRAADLAS